MLKNDRHEEGPDKSVLDLITQARRDGYHVLWLADTANEDPEKLIIIAPDVRKGVSLTVKIGDAG